MNYRNTLFTTALVLVALLGSAQFGNHEIDLTENNPSVSPANYKWEQILPFGNGSFQEEWRPDTFPLGLKPMNMPDGSLLMLGQKAAWISTDGLHWGHHPKKDWGERIWMEYTFFKNKLWMFGGMKYNDRQVINEIWSSTDGIQWKQMANAPWHPRKGHSIVAFQGKLWLFGGAADISKDFVSNRLFNDVWSSEDGIHWKKEMEKSPWSSEESPTLIVFQNALYKLGGQGKADIWRSSDGKRWSQLVSEAEWKPRFANGALVFDNKLWVFGGYDTTANHNTGAKNDVWYSPDGVQWTQQTEHAPWTVRSGGTSVVFKNKVWLFSGKHTNGKHNWGGDVWTMAMDK